MLFQQQILHIINSSYLMFYLWFAYFRRHCRLSLQTMIAGVYDVKES